MKKVHFLLTALMISIAFGARPHSEPADQVADPCADAASNPIACENTLPGNPASEWDIVGSGSPLIQGFATEISVNRGQTIRFKIETPATAYQLDIYRLGYYGGNGARKVATVTPSAMLPQAQPACLSDAATGLVDCGNWSESASWLVPDTAVSGVYLAKAMRTDGTAGASHIIFVVRDDSGRSDLLVQTSDATWHAYNQYGGNSLYTGSPAGRAYKVSYNRPLMTRGHDPATSPFNAEYPMIRWLEANGYDVSYTTGVDTDRRGAELLEHKVFISSGHDEYWSGAQRANVEAARTAGVNLAFFSGNEVFWKTRWENAIDGSGTPYRTLVCYKETHANAKIDPQPGVWTGTWRDPRFSGATDGGRPENSLTGTIFTVNNGSSGAIQVPAEFGRLRFWRNTSVATLAAGETATLPDGTLGFEWDEALNDAARPVGLVSLSRTTRNVTTKLLDYGSTFGNGVATHSLTLYRDAASGALVFGAGTVQWSWGLDAAHDRGSSTPDIRMQQATLNLLADMGTQPATPQTGLIPSPAADDNTAPVSTILSPAASAALQRGIPVTIQGSASDADGAIAYVEVSTDGGTTWAVADGTTTWSHSWTPDALGSALLLSRAVDESANVQTAVSSVAVTVTPPPLGACPCSIWDGSTVPSTIDSGPDNSVELGVKFRSDTVGYVTAIRFYKSAANTGPHTGTLWAANGTKLATATFTAETSSGWQTAALDAPVAITPNTTYIASYHTNVGHYAFTGSYFAAAGVDNGRLHALANPVSPNGVFRYGTTSAFPNSSFQSGNYWVDVLFETELIDATAPVVTGTTPAPSAAVALPSQIDINFSEPLDPASVTAAAFEIRDEANATIAATAVLDATGRRVVLTPSVVLGYLSTYSVAVKSGASGVKDVAGNGLAVDYNWTFSTGAAPPPPPDEGPGGPILVVGSTANPFSRYYAEILRAEGLNAFAVADIAQITSASLAAYDLVVVGNIPLTSAQVTMFGDFVNAGGRLIAMRPDKQLASLLGLADANATLADQYLLIDTASAPGAGLVGETIQFHGQADLYTTAGATTIATLYSSATTSAARPAVTLRSVGSNGGQAAAFTFDLARSIVYTRQGNPAWAGQDRDGTLPIRSDDMFFGGAGERDWVDLTKVAIPQADEQQRLLANLILQMNASRRPLPRFWYLPRGLKAAVVMTGDDHGNGGTLGRFNQFIAASPLNCSVDDWECVRGSSYIFPNTPITAADAASYDALGFEFGVHINTGCADYASGNIGNIYTSQLTSWNSKYTTVAAPTTNRTHCIVWSDWSSQVTAALQNGIRLDTNYYYWPGAWVNNRPGMFTGSGMPMRFADSSGQMLDVYQATTQMTDESAQSFPFTSDTLLDRALGAEGYYGVFTANMHTDHVVSLGATAIVASAMARGVPVISARQLLTWLDGRNGSTFRNITWTGSVLTFDIEMGVGARGLRAMAPGAFNGYPVLSITADGAAVPFTVETIKGVSYATFQAGSASYRVTYNIPAPETTITAGPAATAAVTTATFEFGATEPGATFECALDGATFAACSSPRVYSALAAGAHAFQVRATGIGGTDASPATWNWAIALPVPDTSIATGPAAASTTTSATFQFTATLAGATFECSLDSGAFAACIAPLTYSGLAPGAHNFRVRAIGPGGADPTPASWNWTITLPVTDTAITAGPSASSTATTATFQFTATLTGATFECSLDSGAFASCVSPRAYSSLAPGAHSFRVRAIGPGGADPTPASWNWTITLPVPDTTITAGPTGLVTTRTAAFTFTATMAGSTFQCSLNGAAFTSCVSPVAYANLADAAHSFSVRAVSSAGADPTPAVRTWTVDATAPVISAVAATATTTGATITWTTNEASDSIVTYGTSAASLTSTASVATMVTSHSVTLSGLTAGRTYYYRVTSRNAAALSATAPATAATFATRTIVAQAPATTTITTGSLMTGTAASLATDNATYYVVNSTTSGSTRTSTWYGAFTGVSRSLANLTVSYSGGQSRSVTQHIEIYRWSDATWVTLRTATIGTTEVAATGLVPAGAAVNYVSTAGEVRVRVRSVGTTSSFFTAGDFLQIGFDRP